MSSNKVNNYYHYAKLVKYEQIVVRNLTRKTSQGLAKALYKEWENLDCTDESLAGILRAMFVKGLSTYDLECLTNKRLVICEGGYELIDKEPY